MWGKVKQYFNIRHRSSNPVSARKTLTTPQTFVQHSITARATLAKQRWSSAQEFCVGLSEPCVGELYELASSGAKLCVGVGGADLKYARPYNFLFPHHMSIFCEAQNFQSGRRAPRETSAVAERIRRCFNGDQLLLNGDERLPAVMIFFFTAPGTLQQSSGGVTGP
jgi:hypothetical protein